MSYIFAAEFMARVIGPLYAIVAVGLVVNPDFYRNMTAQIGEQAVVTYLGGILALVTGLLTLNFYPVWQADWTILISVFGWMAVAKGAASVVAPGWLLRLSGPLMQRPSFVRGLGVIVLILGLFLSTKGFGIA